jgi:tRNA1(Val) A37 N6-methylase TrmN6
MSVGFLRGKIQLKQLPMGHRAGTDAVLLAAAAPLDFSDYALDIGSGSGAVGLAFARLRPKARIGLIEKDPQTAALARENLVLNGLQARGAVYEADLFSRASRLKAGLQDGCADLVLTNPPYLDPRKHRLSPDLLRRGAHAMGVEQADHDLAAWIKASLALLQPRGVFIMIHRAEALAEILACSARWLGGLTLLPIYSDAERPAIRILIRGKKGSRAPLSIAPGLVLHGVQGFTEYAEALHSGSKIMIW